MVELSCDWLAGTVPYEFRDELLGRLPGDKVLLERGFRGYAECVLIEGSVFVAWHSERHDMGCHFVMPASGLAVLAAIDEGFEWPGLVEWVWEIGGHLTRVDVAWDDKEGLLDLEQIAEKVGRWELTSWWRGGSVVRSCGDFEGLTVSLGRRGSLMYLRVYDKAAEQGDEGHWVRVELEARKERADVVARLLVAAVRGDEGARVALAGVLREYVQFREPGDDSNKRRWEVSAWWLEFLEFAERVKVVGAAAVRSVEDVQRWIVRQVAPSLALLVDAMGFDVAWGWLYEQSRQGAERLSGRHIAMLARYRAVNGSAA